MDRYNDLVRPLDRWSLDTLLAAGVDAPLARHVAHLFVRDPLVLFDGLIEEVRCIEEAKAVEMARMFALGIFLEHECSSNWG